MTKRDSMAILLWWVHHVRNQGADCYGRKPPGITRNLEGGRAPIHCPAPKQSRANPRVDAAMKLLLPGAPDPEQVTPRGALRSMQRYRLHLGF